MGRFDGYLICADVDGTVAMGKEVPLRNREKIAYFQREGGIFVFSTGRTPGYAEETLQITPNGPCICDNGATIYEPETMRILWHFPLDGAGPLLEWVSGKAVASTYLRFTDARNEYPTGRVVEEYAAHTSGDLLKVLCRFETAEEAIAFRDEGRKIFGPRYDIHRSWDRGVEVVSPLSGKGNGVKHLKALLGEKAKVAVAVGDYENDLTMILAADRSFAPANACPEVLAAAQTRLCRCEEGAIGELIDLLDAEIGGN